ncbi:MAG: helicase HerA-like domain-containing protein [Candidatus Heimdallarchaeota archaeon]
MTEEVPHYSVTEAKIASICPRQFVLNKKYGNRVFRGRTYGVGRIIHRIIEQFAKSALSSNRFINNLETSDEKATYELFAKGIHAKFMEESKSRNLSNWPSEELELIGKNLEVTSNDISDRFLELRKESSALESLKRLFIAIEWSFNHTFTIKEKNKDRLVELGGRIDWLSMDSKDKTMTIWDFKTSPIENIERDLMQIAIYSVTLEEQFGVPISAALFYISKDGIDTRKVSPETLQKFKPRILENLLNMKIWMNDEKKAPFTAYPDVCQDCIVTKHCIKRFGMNPHLKDIISKLQVEKARKDEDLLVEEIVEPQVDFIVRPDEKLIEFVKTGKPRAAAEKKRQNLFLGSNLSDKLPIEIHPLVFVRHGVILGATGSGKTVLGKVIIEEILQHNHSAILIDPQGDLCSLALANSEIGNEMISKVPITIFTPNSDKGKRLTIDLLAPPAKEVIEDPESLTIVLDTTAAQILDVLGYNLKKIPHEKAFIEAILKEDWEKGIKYNIRAFAERVSETTKIRSVLDNSEIGVESLLSAKKQTDLSKNLMKLAIGTEGSFFSGGHPLRLEDLVSKPPRLYIINLASVGTDQIKRQMVVSWILREIYDWLLRNPQKEQDTIRFSLYIDEVADFMPPHPYNPPSKKMLMLLIRQARKYGCACLFATQSPATIDYKAIDNVNSIFIGKIASKQSLKKIETFLEPYGKEVQSLVKNVQTFNPGQFLLIGGGQSKPEIFQTRWLYTKHQTLSLDDVELIMKNKN